MHFANENIKTLICVSYESFKSIPINTNTFFAGDVFENKVLLNKYPFTTSVLKAYKNFRSIFFGYNFGQNICL